MKVDIVIATHDRPQALQEALKSVADQTYPHWTCWVSEDGETKETLEAVKPFLEDDRFKYLSGKHAGFPAVPRNRPIRKGIAEYVAMLDDDDLWLPEKLEKQVAFLDAHPDCVLLGCNAFLLPGAGPWEKCPSYFREYPLKRIRYIEMVEQDYVITSSAITRRQALEEAGLFNETLNPPRADDYELWLRVGALGEIWGLPDHDVVYRLTPKTFNPKMDRHENYRVRANLFEAVLRGTGGMPSPLGRPENAHLADACRRERDFYRAGPRFLGRFRHEMFLKMRYWVLTRRGLTY